MAEIAIQFSGDERDVAAAYEKIIREQQKTIDGLKRMSDESKKGERAAKDLERAAVRVYNETRTPQERHNQRLKELDALLAKNKISQETYARAVAKSRAEMDGAAESGHKAFGAPMLERFANLATAAGVLGLAVGAVTAEYDKLLERQAKSRDVTLSVADAQRAAYRNLGATTDAEREAFDARAKKVSDDTGLSLAGVYQVAGDALSAKGNLSDEQVWQAVESGARLAPDSPTEAKVMSAAALDLQKLAPISGEQAMGFLGQLGVFSHVTSAGAIAKTAPPTVNALMARGATMGQAGALYSAFTQAMVDPQGDVSATAAADFTRQLDELFEGKIAKSDEDKKLWSALGLPSDLADKGVDEQLAYIQSRKDVQDFFLNRMTGQGKALTSQTELVRGAGGAFDYYGDFKSRMPGADAWDDFYRESLGVMDRSPIQQTAELKRRVSGTVEGMAIADQQGARTAITREGLAEIMTQAGFPAWASKLRRIVGEGAPDQMRNFIDEVKLQQDELAHPMTPGTAGGFGQNFYQVPATPRAQTIEETVKANALAEAIPRLEALMARMVEAQQGSNQRLDEANRRAERNRPGGPAMSNPQVDR